MMTKLLIASMSALLLAGCSSVGSVWNKTVDTLNPIDRITPHKTEIQQGNLVTQEMASKLKPGMTPQQVRFILGSPLIVDPFRKDRWDYVYLFRKGGVVTEQRRLTVLFKDDKLVAVEGDVVPDQKPEEATKP
jgi:outer membrane protein assembly factor BamE